MTKHPDHENTFCECFLPCTKCERYRQEQGAMTRADFGKLREAVRNAKPQPMVLSREVPKSTSITLFDKVRIERFMKPTLFKIENFEPQPYPEIAAALDIYENTPITKILEENSMKYTSFKTFVKELEREDSAAGDLAKDIAADEEFPNSDDREVIRSHLVAKNACEAALETFDKTWELYERNK